MPSRFIWRFKLINLNLNFIIDETELELDSNKESGPSGENYTQDLSEYACSYSVDLPTGDNSNWFTYDQLCSLLDFGQQIWDNEFASNFSDVITILDN